MEHLYRLIKDKKVVGYMKLEGGKIWHCMVEQIDWFEGKGCWYDALEITDNSTHINYDVSLEDYIPHDRIDQYTGHNLIDSTKVFENDQFKTLAGYTGTVKMVSCRWVIDWVDSIAHNMKPLATCTYDMIITGIQGVK